jgi:hypothetical protein
MDAMTRTSAPRDLDEARRFAHFITRALAVRPVAEAEAQVDALNQMWPMFAWSRDGRAVTVAPAREAVTC